jgi:hypothetical protein
MIGTRVAFRDAFGPHEADVRGIRHLTERSALHRMRTSDDEFHWLAKRRK